MGEGGTARGERGFEMGGRGEFCSRLIFTNLKMGFFVCFMSKSLHILSKFIKLWVMTIDEI